MSEFNQDGMRGLQEDNQPDIFEMEDSSEGLLYEGFMSSDYQVPAEERTEQTVEETTPEQKPTINFDEIPGTTPENKEEGAKTTQASGINFEDPDAPSKTDEFKAEDAIKQLEALGFKVNKEGQADPLQAKQFEIDQYDKRNEDLKNFILADDLTLCREHVIEEIIADYKKSGRTPDIKSEEFQLEIKYQMAQFEDNSRLASLQANQVRQILNGAIQNNEAKKTELATEIKTTRDQEIAQNRQELQSVFVGYNEKTLFGVKITEDHLKNAYRSITSGEFTKQVESDKALQAEFALFLGLRKDIANSGGGTYNEGIAAAVNALQGKVPAVESSLAKTVSRNGAGSVIDRASAWKNAEKVEETKK